MSDVTELKAHKKAALARAFNALHDAGAFLANFHRDKKPVRYHWLKTPNTIAEALAHTGRGNPVGVRPWSLESVVLDLDESGGDLDAAIARIAETVGAKPWAVCASKTKGRAHLWFKADKAHRNAAWRCGDATGDIRGDKGAVICWKPVDLAKALPARKTAEVARIDGVKAEARKHNRNEGQKTRRQHEGRNNALNQACYAAGLDDSIEKRDRAVRLARVGGLPEREIEATAKSGWESGQAERKEKGITGTLPLTHGGFAKGMAGLGIDIRVNSRAERYEIKPDPGGDWLQLTDTRRSWLWDRLAKKYLYAPEGKAPKDPCPWRMRGVVREDTFGAYLHEHQCDPWVDEYLANLPVWDQTPRIGQLLTDKFGAEQTNVNYWASAQLFLGVLARTYEPGCRLRQSVVLIGPEFTGKSDILRRIFPPKHVALCHGDGLQLNAPQQEKAEAILGKVLVEVADFAGIKKAEIESLKAFLTRVDDGQVRLAYRRDPVSTPRTCIIVATTNEQTPLPNDPGGNTRFLPVRVPARADLADYLNKHRDQLWAEAKAVIEGDGDALLLWKEEGAPLDLVNQIEAGQSPGERAWMPRKWDDDQRALTEDARDADESTENRLLSYLDPANRHTINEIRQVVFSGLSDLGDKRGPSDKAIAIALRNIGWVKEPHTRKGQQMQRYWHGPDYRKQLF